MKRALALLLVGCGAATPTARTTGETDACREDRLAILEAMAASRRDRACATDADCRVITGPNDPGPEYAEVVAAIDGDALDARARDHLDRCGAFAYQAAIDAYREVAAACTDGHCAANETLVHVDPIE